MLRIREIREERGWSQSRLSRETGITQGTLSNVERGVHDPHMQTLRQIAEALDVPLIALLEEGEETPKADAPEATPEERLRVRLRVLPPNEQRSLFLGGLSVVAGVWIAGAGLSDVQWFKSFAAQHDAEPEEVLKALHELRPGLRELQEKYKQQARRVDAEVEAALKSETA